MNKTTMSLRGRLLLLLVAMALLVAAIGVLSVMRERDTMLQDRKDKTRNLVESAAALVVSYEKMAADGKMSEPQAKQQAAAALNSMRYDQREYFFAFDKSLTYVAHGVKPALIGKNLHGVKEGSGQDMGQLFDQALSSGGGKGYASYVWDKPGFDAPQPKISYLMTSPGWGWVLGTGIYLDDVAAAYHKSLFNLALEVGVILLLLAGLGGYIMRSVLGQLGGEPAVTVDIVKRIAAGQLDMAVPVKTGDQDSLLANVAGMQAQLRQLVGEIAAAANRVSEMSDDVSGHAAAVASGSEQQSEAATSMAASIEELTVSINHISDRAQDARSLSEQSGESSQQGSEVISRAVAEMRRINESVELAAGTINELVDKAQVISGIMQVIKDIADQTNLLALNAAIEAARAGEQGRGFAVVADEVRKLSERTAQATEEIAGMIAEIQQSSTQSHGSMEEAVRRAKNGLELAEQGGAAVGEISHSASGVLGVVNDISHALKEQGTASQDIAQYVEQIAMSSSKNAQAASTASAALVDMRQLAGNLRGLVSRFRC
ncbi:MULTISPECIES: methyl-accepting chemotaxis protein [Chromobacterium]|uniref:Methyl-accepting chemotaxis protein n=1 Tax=Chromobacterium aquaticum TaxID=467180 RepID=A0ABV8ZV59_9NEIS|nr:methyl-accepting chemotaxis protein [Chromobacterium aquaticum]MCD5363853.1 methyl-accepting chemotaxis protein [Chromobacterium aquaticum]